MTDLHIRREGRAGRITLDRPQALNALSYEMCREIDAALRRWASDDAVALVIMDATGDKAFCAGGDLAEMYATGRAGDHGYGRRFWADEYRMNARIAEYVKPVVTLMQGFTLGGGVGLGCHASHRILCETSCIAMPECAVGIVPDVGGSRLLARAVQLCLWAGHGSSSSSSYQPTSNSGSRCSGGLPHTTGTGTLMGTAAQRARQECGSSSCSTITAACTVFTTAACSSGGRWRPCGGKWRGECVGLARTVYIHRINGDFPAKNTVYTPCNFFSGQPYECGMWLWMCGRGSECGCGCICLFASICAGVGARMKALCLSLF
jgi:hypothetical protein